MAQYLILFNMIGINESWVLDIQTELGIPLIAMQELQSFTSIEECSLLLPIFKISFTLSNIKNLSYLNEGAILKVALGKTIKDLKYLNLQILQITESTNTQRDITLVATLYKPSYSKSNKILVHKNITSVELIHKLAGAYFDVESNVALSSDRKDWPQFGLSDKTFIEYLWLNSHLSNGILATACSALENKFIIKDIIKEFTKGDYDFRIGYSKKTDKDILISQIFGSMANYGFYNSWATNETTLLNYNKKEDSFDIKTLSQTSLLSTSDKHILNSNVEKDIAKPSFYSDSVYSQSKKSNIFGLTNYAKYQIELKTVGQFSDIKLLDSAYLDLNNETKGNEEYFSGNYLVTRVVRHISDSNISTKLVLSRESPGNAQGSSLR